MNKMNNNLSTEVDNVIAFYKNSGKRIHFLTCQLINIENIKDNIKYQIRSVREAFVNTVCHRLSFFNTVQSLFEVI